MTFCWDSFDYLRWQPIFLVKSNSFFTVFKSGTNQWKKSQLVMNVILFILMSLYASYFWRKKRVHLTRKLLSLSGLCVLHIVLKWGRKNRWFLEKVASTQSNHYYHYHHRSRRNEWFFIGHHGFFFAIATFVLMINIIFVAPQTWSSLPSGPKVNEPRGEPRHRVATAVPSVGA